MEIKRLGENKIRCALSEAEIRGMGFEIDDIIGNGKMTQQFMKLVLKLVEEEEDISLEHISPMVKAELLADHSMAITFGGDSDMSFQDIMSAVNQLVGHMSPEKIEEFKGMSTNEKQQMLDDFLAKKDILTKEKKLEEKASQKDIGESLVCALKFQKLEEAVRMSKVSALPRIPQSALYRLERQYYLIIDFSTFKKEEMSGFAASAAEYDDGHISSTGKISYIVEHGDCIVKKEALQTLMQL